MSSWKELEKVGLTILEEGGKRLQRKLTITEEEKLLELRYKKRKAWEGHRNAYWVVCLALTAMLTLVAKTPIPGIVTALGWGIGFMLHTLNHRAWRTEHHTRLLAAERVIRENERTDLYHLLEEGREPSLIPSFGVIGPMEVGTTPASPKAPALSAGPPVHPLQQKCEAAAEQTRTALQGLGLSEVDALAYIHEGLERVRSLLNQESAIRAALREAEPEKLDGERRRVRQKLDNSSDPDTRALYEQQLELLAAREEKVRALNGLLERIEAFADSYVTSLTNIRMDAASIKASDLPQGGELTRQFQSSRALEKQLEAMRRASAEVARYVGSGAK